MSVRSKFRASFVIALPAIVVAAAFSQEAPQAPIQLEGAPNFRDVGGYKTGNGMTVKLSQVYRSGQLSSLTSDDLQKLENLHIRYVFDLRSSHERTAAPTRWQGEHPQFIDLPLGNLSKGVNDPTKTLPPNISAEEERSALASLTAEIALTGAEDMGKIMRDLAAGDEPAVIHCTAGKDRTGVTVAVLLTILGVPRDVVLADYARSTSAVQLAVSRSAQGQGLKGVSMPNASPDVMKAELAADPAYLEAAFSAIDQRYGSFDNYLRDGLHLDAAQVQELRAKMLQP